jgi:hypothetical protein
VNIYTLTPHHACCKSRPQTHKKQCIAILLFLFYSVLYRSVREVHRQRCKRERQLGRRLEQHLRLRALTGKAGSKDVVDSARAARLETTTPHAAERLGVCIAVVEVPAQVSDLTTGAICARAAPHADRYGHENNQEEETNKEQQIRNNMLFSN